MSLEYFFNPIVILKFEAYSNGEFDMITLGDSLLFCFAMSAIAIGIATIIS